MKSGLTPPSPSPFAYFFFFYKIILILSIDFRTPKVNLKFNVCPIYLFFGLYCLSLFKGKYLNWKKMSSYKNIAQIMLRKQRVWSFRYYQ